MIMSRRREAFKLSTHRNCVVMARLRSRKSGDGEAALRRDVGEDEEREEEREGEEEEGEEDEEEQEEEITEYEKQRLKTIERNKAMLASLQLPDLASSLALSSKAGSISKSKGGGPRRRSERLKSVSGKRSAVGDDSSSSEKSDSETESLSPNKRKRKDQEYEPTDDEGSLSESEDELDEHEEEVLQEDAPRAPDNVDIDDEEYALQQALALSLGASIEATDSPAFSKRNKKRSSAKKKKAAESAEIDPVDDELEDNPNPKPSKGKAKRKNQKMGNKRHFTEGEVDALFPFFDERGRGLLTLNDLERVSTTHDFTWSAEDLLDMIHLFSRNHNGALDLVDFRNVATRCNLVISER